MSEMNSHNIDSGKDFELHYFCVAFVDLLDQSNRLRKFPAALTHSPEEKMELLPLIKNTFMVVHRFQNAFKTYFQSFMDKDTGISELVPLERKEEFERIKKRDVRIQGFSDCAAIYVPLIEGRDIFIPIFGVHGVLMACGSLFTLFLATGNAMRAGIDTGLGAEWQPHEFYGPVLQSAYEIERCAEEPRIVIGKGMLEYLTSEEQLQGNNVRANIGRAVAQKCKSFIIQDHDGKMILDYLGQSFKDELDSFWKKIPALDAFDFVAAEKNRLEKEKDQKLISRYQKLHNYMAERIPLWQGAERLPLSKKSR